MSTSGQQESEDPGLGTRERRHQQRMKSAALSSDHTRSLGTDEELQSLTAKRSLEKDAFSKTTGGDFGICLFWGLTLAGIASSMLTTTFGIFHVDVFLRSYQLPLSTYSYGNAVYAIINTANDLAGAWLVDHVATHRNRTDLVGMAGCIFAVCFLTPFFRWRAPSQSWDGVHFVTTLSLYDTMFAFVAILMGSIITDNHKMSENSRVRFMASGKLINLFTSFVVARAGLSTFDVQDLTHFRIFVVCLAMLVSLMFIIAQRMIHVKSRTVTASRQDALKVSASATAASSQKGKLHWRQVALDFWRHRSFRAWIGMEMLLEAQMTFMSSFTKTFVDRLLFDSGYSRASCVWLLSTLRPIKAIAGILIYVPIRKFGYTKIYSTLFVFNFLLSATLLTVADSSSTRWILTFLVLYSVITGAVQSSGFHLAMSDMVTEMKRNHAKERRFEEPSLAGLFMGANALFCKPMESLLPIVAGTVLQNKGDSQQNLFYLLVIPVLLFSVAQFLFWSRYELTPDRMKGFRHELDSLHSEQGRACTSIAIEA
jgi:hypothetical protein